ncbi:hypothetical protein [Pseudoroseicyclus sp. CXY001]|uniref:hypothetical protein n=1 Tax=Pseudoroseicyclus sp. CXY001 TaxID=3242492 RepID=UPI00358DA07D
MYPKDDLRATLNSGPAAAPDSFKSAEYARFYDMPPQETEGDSQSWYARGQNLVVSYTDGKAGLVLTRAEQVDEYAILLPDRATRIRVEAGGAAEEVEGPSVVFVPPGPSAVTLQSDAVVVRLITTENPDAVERCVNAAAYAERDPNVPPLERWPAPPGGWAIRAYSLDVPMEKGRFGRLFRCTTIMINAFDISPPRDPGRMSPHSHDNFEQYSLCLKGAYTHYLRWPWTNDLSQWRPDDAETCGAPSVAVIPPPTIHTSRSLDPDGNRLVDIFSPPRFDFSTKEGWVLNAADYPAPAES